MFSYDFITRGKRAIYGPSIPFRLLCATFSFFLTIGFITVSFSGSLDAFSIIPITIDVLLLFCLFYRDSWIFDNESETIEYIWGLGPFVKREKMKYSDIQRIEITHFIKGIPDSAEKQEANWRHKTQVVFSIRINEDEKHDLEIMSERRAGDKLERHASWLSRFTGLALFIDRPWSMRK